LSNTVTNTATYTPTPTPTHTATQTPTATVSNTPTDTPTNTITDTPTITNTPTLTDTPTITSTPTVTSTSTVSISLALGANRFDDLSDPPLRVDYWVVNGGAVQVRVYNVVGLAVRHLTDADMQPGAYTLYWDGKDDTGAPLASGLYLVAVKEPGRVDIKKVLVLKQ
jgi:hypothetical protein